MSTHPYEDLPPSAFWKNGVAQENPFFVKDIYKKKFNILPNHKIAAAGSCFAQHISRYLRKSGYNILDVEPAPPGLPNDLHQKYGYSMYSARYGNIYTVRQLLQLSQEALGEWTPADYIWEKNGRFFDALRPAVEPNGLDTPDEVTGHRRYHIERVKELFEELDLFVFTLGLTEMWVHKMSGTVYPTAPGTIAGNFDEDIYEFRNANFNEINSDFNDFVSTIRKIRGNKQFRILLTVSPVPLTATASGKHVLTSTSYSKSTLRSVAGWQSARSFIDYFPSYEIITNPRFHSSAFSENLRSIRGEAVDSVMSHFFAEHPVIEVAKGNVSKSKIDNVQDLDGIQCEEALLEAFEN
jgi:hypothetical protein